MTVSAMTELKDACIMTLAELEAKKVDGLLIAMGSNHEPQKNLSQAYDYLNGLGSGNGAGGVVFSEAMQTPDYTATGAEQKPDYINQCAKVDLAEPHVLAEVIAGLKQIEAQCQRQEMKQNLTWAVTLDLDVLAVRLATDEKQELQNKQNNIWVFIKKRYPLKAHEQAGILLLQ